MRATVGRTYVRAGGARADDRIAIDAAELLMTCGRVDAAAELLHAAAAGAAAAGAAAADPRLLRVLSAADQPS